MEASENRYRYLKVKTITLFELFLKVKCTLKSLYIIKEFNSLWLVRGPTYIFIGQNFTSFKVKTKLKISCHSSFPLRIIKF